MDRTYGTSICMDLCPSNILSNFSITVQSVQDKTFKINYQDQVNTEHISSKKKKKKLKKGGAKKVKETIWLPTAKRINCERDEGIFFRLLYMTTPCINQTKKHS